MGFAIRGATTERQQNRTAQLHDERVGTYPLHSHGRGPKGETERERERGREQKKRKEEKREEKREK